MASFTEQATLRVNDQSTAAIRRINAELRKLQSTARSIRNLKIDLKVNATGLQAANRQLNTLAHNLRQVGRFNTQIRVNTAGLQTANAQIARLRSQAAQPINIRTTHTGGAGMGGVGGGGGPRYGGGGGGRSMLGAAAYGAGVGLGYGLWRLTGSMGAVTLAGYAAAKALQSVAQSGAVSDRAMLRSKVMATEEQRQIFEREGFAQAPAGASLKFTEAERRDLWGSLLGNVGGETAAEVARAAGGLTRELERTFLPRMLAAAPEGTDRAQVLSRMYMLVKGMDLATNNLTDATGAFTADGLRVAKAIQVAMAADPGLTPELIKTTIAGAKTGAYMLNTTALARMLINAGARGQSAGNQLFQAMKAMTGQVDNKRLNEALAKWGFLEDYERKPGRPARPGRKGRPGRPAGPPGSIITSSGMMVDPELWASDPYAWLQKYYVGGMIKRAAADRQSAENLSAKREGRKARDMTKVAPTPEAQQAAMASRIAKDFAGMRDTAINAITTAILGDEQDRRSLAQALRAVDETNVPKAIAESWTAQAENVATAWKDAGAKVFESISKGIGLPEMLGNLEKLIRENPTMAVATAAGGAAIAVGGLGYAAIGAAAALGRIALMGGIPPVPPPLPGGPAGPAAASSVMSRIFGVAGRYLLGPLGILLGSTESAGGQSNLVILEQIRAANSLMAQSSVQLQEARNALATAKDPATIAQLNNTITALESVIEGAKRTVEMLTGDKAYQPKAWVSPEAQAEPPSTAWIDDVKNSLNLIISKFPEVPAPAAPFPIPLPVTPPQGAFPGPTGAVPTVPEIPKTIEVTPSPLPIIIPEPPKPLLELPPLPNYDEWIKGFSALGAVPDQFSSVFGTGASSLNSSATAIGASGSTAAGSITGAMPGAGATLGNAAVAAIQAGVANLNINVNANVTPTVTPKADAGAQVA